MPHPQHLHPKPPYPEKNQPVPGFEREMEPQADHGEESYQGCGRLKGRKAFITGADSGIGRAVAIAFAREGADVAIGFLSEEEEDAKTTAEWIKKAGRQALLLPGDISNRETCRLIAEKACSTFGSIDILVNNAAYQRTYDSFGAIPDDEFEEAFRVNVFAMFWLCKDFLPSMKEGSCIINTASIQSFDPGAHLVPYAATKAAIASFTRSLANLVIDKGIRVNAVAPGPVWTPLIPSTMDAKKVKQFGAHTAFKRAAQPAELAPIYVFLASDQASYVTGEVYGASGGQTPL